MFSAESGGRYLAEPLIDPVALLTLSASHAATAILAALIKRLRCGDGAYIEVALWDVAVTAINGAAVTAADARSEARDRDRGPVQAPYKTADGGFVLLGFVLPAERGFWTRFCAVLDLADLTALPEQDPARTFKALASVMRTRTQREWIGLATREKLPITPVLDSRADLSHPQAQARAILDSGGASSGEFVTRPAVIVGEHMSVGPAPTLGQDTADIAAEIERQR